MSALPSRSQSGIKRPAASGLHAHRCDSGTSRCCNLGEVSPVVYEVDMRLMTSMGAISDTTEMIWTLSLGSIDSLLLSFGSPAYHSVRSFHNLRFFPYRSSFSQRFRSPSDFLLITLRDSWRCRPSLSLYVPQSNSYQPESAKMPPNDQIVDDEEPDTCPLCIEELDLSDRGFKPCPCGYQVRQNSHEAS